MNYSILQNARTVTLTPFPYLLIDPCLPEDLYDELEATRILDTEIVKGLKLGPNVRTDLHAVQLLSRGDLAPVWRDFINYHLSHEFWQEIVEWFGEGIDQTHGPSLSGDRKKWSVYVRHSSPLKDAIAMEVNVGVNTPATGNVPTRVRGPHVDNAVELFAAMLYMAPRDAFAEGGDFVVYDRSKLVRFEGKAEVRHEDESSLREVVRIPYKRNTMVAFINSLHSIHGVTPRVSTQYRRLVNFCAELPYAAFQLPHKRGV